MGFCIDIRKLNFRDNPKLGDGNYLPYHLYRIRHYFRDNPKLGDGNEIALQLHSLLNFRDNPKLGDGNSMGCLYSEFINISEITPN